MLYGQEKRTGLPALGVCLKGWRLGIIWVLIFILSMVLPVLAVSRSAQAATETTVSALMASLKGQNKQAVYNMELNAPFAKDTSGVRETISLETGELLVNNQIFDIAGINGQNISLNLVYRSRDAKAYDEGTTSAAITNSYGQIIAYYEVYDAGGNWLRTGALLYAASETTIAATVARNGESWVFNGYLQYPSGTSVFSVATIQNNLRAKSNVEAAKSIFGAGWSLDIPSLDVDGQNVYVNLPSGSTYAADFTNGIGLKNYEFADIVFTKDTTASSGSTASAYKLYYVSGDAYYFSASGELLCQKNKFGNFINYTWQNINGLNLLVKVTDAAGHYVDIEYNGTATHFKTGNRVVTLKKELMPGQTNKYYLSAFIDAEGRQFKYFYNFENAAFDALGKTAVSNTYANLNTIVYPTGAKTEYVYESGTKNLTNVGYMGYFKVKQRQDVENGKILNRLYYGYYNEPDGYPTYKPTAIGAGYRYATMVTDAKGIATQHIFNSEHQPYIKQTYLSGRLLEKVITSYHLTQKMPEKIYTKTFNANGNATEYTDIYKYDYRGNVVWENHYEEDNASAKHKVSYTYSYEYNLLTQKTYKQDANTAIKEEYALTQDKKAVQGFKLYSNGELLLKKAYAYDERGNLIRETALNAQGKATSSTYEYGSQYNKAYLTRVTHEDVADADGNKTPISLQYSYDFATGLKLSQTDGKGQVTSYTYDKLGRLVKETLPDNSCRTYSYFDAENIIKTVDAAGGSLTYYYSGLGNLLKVKDNASVSVLAAFEYDAYENQIKQYDANGNYRENIYDATGRITRIRNFDEAGKALAKTLVIYDEAYPYKDSLFYRIKVIQQGDETDKTVMYYYDADDRLAMNGRLINGTEQISRYSYDYLGNNTSVTDFAGITVTSAFNALGQLTQAVNGLGNAVNYTYDERSNLLSQTDALSQTTYFTYDMLGRQVLSEKPYQEGSYSQIKNYYDAGGNLTKTVDAEGYVTNYHYNSRNFLTAVESLLGNDEVSITKYEYDAEGRNTKVFTGLNSWQDAEYQTVSYGYDSLGRLVTETDALGQKTFYTYDAAGNLISCTDRNGITVSYTYDGLNRLIGKENSHEGSKNAVSYMYDALGNLQKMSDATGETVYCYDELGRVTCTDYTNGIRQCYTYNNSDKLINLLVQNGSLTEMDLGYTYDAAGNLTAVNDGGKSFRYSYDATGRLTQEQNGVTGIKTEYAYYASGSLKSLRNFSGDTLLDNYEYAYDKRGNRVQETIGSETTKYYYDALSRITTQLTPEGGSQNYSYDDFGNINQMVEVGQTALGSSQIVESNYSYDQNNRLILQETLNGNNADQIRFLYDKEGNQVEKAEISKYEGNLIAENTLSFYYNGYNQLAHIEDADGRLTVYSYNGNGLRTAKQTADETTNFYYDANANIILETDEFNAITAKNVRGLHLISRENAGEDSFYYLYNAHGDVTKLVDELGNVLTDYSYDPFGNQKEQLLSAAAGNLKFSQWQAETQQINNPFRYCGEYLDSETGNYYLRARYYDPETQRFISEDAYKGKLTNPLTLNLYTYCLNNPILYVDPSGHIGILPNGSIYMAEGDTDIDKQLLELKQAYSKASTAKEKKDIADKAIKLRNNNPGKWHVSFNKSLDYYKIYDVTDKLNLLMKEADEKYGGFHLGDVITVYPAYKFYTLVKNGATYDLKRKPDWQHEHFIYNNEVIDKDAPGNIIYGYLGKVMGFSDESLCMAAGAYQLATSDYEKKWLLQSFGDDPRDQYRIIQGINIYKSTHSFWEWSGW